MFEPENEIENLMISAASDPKAVLEFYRALPEVELFLLTPEAIMTPGRRRAMKFNEKMNIATVDFLNLKWHPTFTSRQRIADYLKQPETCLGAKAKNLFKMLPKSNFWLNPLSACQKPLPADEIALVMSGKIFDKLNHSA